jgi:hypothetical protein
MAVAVLRYHNFLFSMEDIRDDGGATEEPLAHDSPEDFLTSMRRLAADYRRDRTEGQPRKLMIFCEAAGMIEWCKCPRRRAPHSPFDARPVLSSTDKNIRGCLSTALATAVLNE